MKTKETKLFGPTKICIQLAAILTFFLAIAFSHSAVIVIFSVALMLTVSFCFQPNLFRDRFGSLVPILCILAVAWLGAIGMFFYWLFSRH